MCSTANDNKNMVCFVCEYEHKKKHVSLKEIEKAFRRGVELYNGKKYEEAYELISFAAERKYLSALVLVAELYEAGCGTEVDLRKSYESYHIAAQKNDAYAQYKVATCYYLGKGTKQSYSLAIKWLEKAIAQGYPDAFVLLANMYLAGEGVWSDYDKAVEYYKNALNCFSLLNEKDPSKEAEILLGIGKCYHLLGKDVRAAKFFKKSSKFNCAEAQYMLAKCYRLGRGVFKNETKAREWYAKAKCNGYRKKEG